MSLLGALIRTTVNVVSLPVDIAVDVGRAVVNSDYDSDRASRRLDKLADGADPGRKDIIDGVCDSIGDIYDDAMYRK